MIDGNDNPFRMDSSRRSDHSSDTRHQIRSSIHQMPKLDNFFYWQIKKKRSTVYFISFFLENYLFEKFSHWETWPKERPVHLQTTYGCLYWWWSVIEECLGRLSFSRVTQNGRPTAQYFPLYFSDWGKLGLKHRSRTHTSFYFFEKEEKYLLEEEPWRLPVELYGWAMGFLFFFLFSFFVVLRFVLKLSQIISDGITLSLTWLWMSQPQPR